MATDISTSSIPDSTRTKFNYPTTMGISMMQPRFQVGKVFATPGAIALGVDLAAYLRRHHCGDWGEELCEDDKQANEDAMELGGQDPELLQDTEW